MRHGIFSWEISDVIRHDSRVTFWTVPRNEKRVPIGPDFHGNSIVYDSRNGRTYPLDSYLWIKSYKTQILKWIIRTEKAHHKNRRSGIGNPYVVPFSTLGPYITFQPVTRLRHIAAGGPLHWKKRLFKKWRATNGLVQISGRQSLNSDRVTISDLSPFWLMRSCSTLFHAPKRPTPHFSRRLRGWFVFSFSLWSSCFLSREKQKVVRSLCALGRSRLNWRPRFFSSALG